MRTNLLPVQLKIRFIFVFLIPTLFLFQFLKYTKYQALLTRDARGQNIKKKMSDKNGKLLLNFNSRHKMF